MDGEPRKANGNQAAAAGGCSGAPAFVIREDDLSGEAVRELLAFHLAEAHRNSPPGAVFALGLAGLAAPEVTVWTAWCGERIAGLGALKLLGDGTAEVKSMRTHPEFLGRGVGGAVLDRIIATAAMRGVRRLSLETGRGDTFAAALALYGKRGFAEGGAFAGYRPNGFSRFLHLELGGSAGPFPPAG